MSPTPEHEAEIQERIERVLDAFEAQDYEVATELFVARVHEFTHQGNSEAALKLAESVDVYRDQLPEELLNRFDIKLAEASFYAGRGENTNLEDAETTYQRVADAEIPELPAAGEELTEEERRRFSEHFHALDRLADVAFASGRFAEAQQRYAEAFDTRGTFQEVAAERGPLACAKYGEAAMALLQGDQEAYTSALGEARKFLTGLEAQENELLASVDNVESAQQSLAELDENEREQVLVRVRDTLEERGGGNGGVKHTNFRELVDVAVVEVREGQT